MLTQFLKIKNNVNVPISLFGKKKRRLTNKWDFLWFKSSTINVSRSLSEETVISSAVKTLDIKN